MYVCTHPQALWYLCALCTLLHPAILPFGTFHLACTRFSYALTLPREHHSVRSFVAKPAAYLTV